MKMLVFAMFELFINPFVEFSFMQSALWGCIIICLSAVPVGVFMLLRRMSLTGDAIAHSILPGVGIAYLLFGFSIFSMTIGGLIAGLLVVILSGISTKHTQLKEDANLAVLYLLSLALGVLILSNNAEQIDLFHLLFGSILTINVMGLQTLIVLNSLSVIVLIIIYRPLIVDSLDPIFLNHITSYPTLIYYTFLVLVVINLVSGFYTLGTLLAVGIMILPAACAKFWVKTLKPMIFVSLLIAIIACYSGLLLSYYYDFATGPIIILNLGVMYVISVLLGRQGGVIYRYFAKTHLTG